MPYNKLHDRGYTSIGDVHSTAKVVADEEVLPPDLEHAVDRTVGAVDVDALVRVDHLAHSGDNRPEPLRLGRSLAEVVNDSLHHPPGARRHPTKRLSRPLAAGRVRPGGAIALLGVMLLGLAVAAIFQP